MCVWNDYDNDDRIQKKALTLSKKFKVVVKSVCKNEKTYAKKKINNNLEVQYYWFDSSVKWFVNRLVLNERFWEANLEEADIYDCNDPDTLYAGVLAKKKYGSKLVYDSHEYWRGTMRREYTFYYTLYSYIGNTIQYLRQEAHISKADKIICVSESIKNILQKKYKKPTYLIPNYSRKENFNIEIANKLSKKKVVFVGSKFRLGIEKIIDDFANNGYEVIVVGNAKETNPKITYKGFIPKQEYMQILKDALIGLAYMDITCKNIEYSLPNKLFEYIQAGVIPIVNYDNIDSSKIVYKEEIGISIKPSEYNFQAIENKINKNAIKYLYNLVTARNYYCWEMIESKLLHIYSHFKDRE